MSDIEIMSPLDTAKQPHAVKKHGSLQNIRKIDTSGTETFVKLLAKFAKV